MLFFKEASCLGIGLGSFALKLSGNSRWGTLSCYDPHWGTGTSMRLHAPCRELSGPIGVSCFSTMFDLLVRP